MKIVVLDGYAGNPGDLSWDALGKLGELTVYDRTPAEPNLVMERIGDAEIVFTNKTPLSRQILTACPNLKFVGILATGYNIVDVDAAKELGIPVCNVPGYSTDAVAQMTLALLLEICHHVAHHSQQVHAGQWSRLPRTSASGITRSSSWPARPWASSALAASARRWADWPGAWA